MMYEPTPIDRIYNMPGHKHYGPCRRMWMMLEQLFADGRGIAAFEIHMHAHQTDLGRGPLFWDRHLAWLIEQGQSEAAAQRLVMHQLMVAAEWIP